MRKLSAENGNIFFPNKLRSQHLRYLRPLIQHKKDEKRFTWVTYEFLSYEEIIGLVE